MKLALKPTIAVVSAFSVVFVVGYFVLIAPDMASIGENLVRLSHYDSLSITPAKKTTVATIASYQQQADLVNTLLPAESQLYDLSVQVEALAKSGSISLTNLTLNPAADGLPQTTSSQATAGAIPLPAGVVKAALGLGVHGSYTSAQAFLEGLTRLNRYIQIENVTIAKADTANVDMQITASTYYLPYATAKK